MFTPTISLRPVVVTALAALAALAAPVAPGAQEDGDAVRPADYLTFGQGAVAVSVRAQGANREPGEDVAMMVIDGDPTLRSLLAGGRDAALELVFALPATTRFERFAVPGIGETPSPSQTFFRRVEVAGSEAGPEGPWTPLAEAELETHAGPGQVSEIPVIASPGVRWVKVRLAGGIEVGGDLMFYEFSELIGHGSQEEVPLSARFGGVWKGRGVLVELHQDGAVVSGCVDADGDPFEGTVSGNLLRGRSVDRDSGVESLFVLTVTEAGDLSGVRSTNGAPFRLHGAPPAPAGTTTDCSAAPVPRLGCGSVIHGITFDVDSAVIRPRSEPVLAQLFDGLAADPEAAILVEGHTSSEGSTEHNQGLSERRAAAVVAHLVARGLAPERVRSAGRGESSPIAPNDTESGRALNRRVEIHCDAAP